MRIAFSVGRSLVIMLAFVALSSCASGEKFTELQTTIAPPAAENGRIYIYRTAVAGTAVQPAVKVNGEKVGNAVPNGFFYVDRPAGDYEITTETEVKRALTLKLEPGQTRYVKLNIGFGFFVGHVWPELVDNATGEKEIAKLRYAPPKQEAKS
jgi:hypothetical protein